MSTEEIMKIQTCVLKVHIHCDGCKQKVKKILQKIEGVITTKIDSEQGKVTVSGSVDPSVLVKKLAKSGKHGEIWGAPKGNNNPNQFKGMQIDNGKGGDGNNKNIKKGQKGGVGGGGNSNAPKMGQQPDPQQMQQLEKMKGFQDLKLPPQLKGSVPVNKNENQKGVKFDAQDDDDDDDFCDEFDDDFTDDDEEDEFDDLSLPSNKMKPNNMMPNAQQMMNAQKRANLGGGNQNQSAGKKGGKNSGGGCHPQNGKNGGGGGGDGPNSGKKDNGPNGGGGHTAGGMPNGGSMGNISAVHGLPATNTDGAPPCYFQGSRPDPMQQQQYLTAVMNQQRAMENERFQPMMYGRPPSAVNYMPPHPHQYPNPYAYPYPYPYPYPPYGNDPYSYAFSDDNTSSCDIM